MPRITVISIFYNAEKYFVEAIESVLAQDCQDFEFLLVDDGSKDAGTAIARDYCARYSGKVFYLEHEGHANRGMSATRNLGLSHARGEFVTFIDSDDRWRPSKLREQLAIMDAHPDVGCVAGTVNYWRGWNHGRDRLVRTGHVQDRVILPPEATLALYPLGKAKAPPPSDLMLRRSVVEKVGGFEAHFTGPRQMYEDQGFLGKLYLEAPVFFSSKVWLDYRQHEESCVAEVSRGGHYDTVRTYYLDWFQTYLDRIGNTDPAIHHRLARALFPYRHPRLGVLLLMPRRIAERFRRARASVRARLTRRS